jgi:hypothetical protein
LLKQFNHFNSNHFISSHPIQACALRFALREFLCRVWENSSGGKEILKEQILLKMKSMKPTLLKITYLDFNGIKLYLLLKYSKLSKVDIMKVDAMRK